ncbi:hypothetical protein [Streptomyces sp. TLI_053]|uniref:hypothetical protein n=1 Tax=Streptomyces sp. TLI_053 TaxID=1855352 RepID=UPI001E5EB672|nr:hypothetical protein [Streptomyces sp. TLI_053]
MIDDSPDVPLTDSSDSRADRCGRSTTTTAVGFTAGLTLQFPGGSVRLLGLVDDLLVAHDRHPGAVEAHLHEDVTLTRVVQTSGGCPSQWAAWTARGHYLYLRYRHGKGTVEQHPSEDVGSWDGEESRLWTSWDDGTDGGRIDLTDYVATAGLRPAPDTEVRTTPPIDRKA